MKNNISESIQNYLAELTDVKRVSENTIVAYQTDLDQFYKFLMQKEITSFKSLSERIIRLYILKLNEDKLNRNSIGRKLSTLRGYVNYLLRLEIIKDDILLSIKNPKRKRVLPEIITLDSFLKIIKLIDEESDYSESKKDFRNHKLIFELLYGCALRVSELCNLNIGDIDLNRQSIRVIGKGRKTRIVPLGDKSAVILQDYLSTRTSVHNLDPLILTNTNKRLYPKYVSRLVKKYLSKISDVSKKSPHVFRHSAATHMLDEGADLLAVKEILGHENLSTTQIYTQVSVERLKKAYKKAHPKS
ncbi:MAG: tyrosine-type recombinase/integrase [Ignavibacteriae bacterium]|nr:tyrosine-type recombinase/integrase [Ignavibacteriota bacterium]